MTKESNWISFLTSNLDSNDKSGKFNNLSAYDHNNNMIGVKIWHFALQNTDLPMTCSFILSCYSCYIIKPVISVRISTRNLNHTLIDCLRWQLLLEIASQQIRHLALGMQFTFKIPQIPWNEITKYNISSRY